MLINLEVAYAIHKSKKFQLDYYSPLFVNKAYENIISYKQEIYKAHEIIRSFRSELKETERKTDFWVKKATDAMSKLEAMHKSK
jgi:hypothetical protein